MHDNVTFVAETNASASTSIVAVNGSLTESVPLNGDGFSFQYDGTFNVLKAVFGAAGILANLFIIVVITGFTQSKNKVKQVFFIKIMNFYLHLCLQHFTYEAP